MQMVIKSHAYVEKSMQAFEGALSDAIVGVIHAEVEADDGQRRRKQPVGDAWEPKKYMQLGKLEGLQT